MNIRQVEAQTETLVEIVAGNDGCNPTIAKLIERVGHLVAIVLQRARTRELLRDRDVKSGPAFPACRARVVNRTQVAGLYRARRCSHQQRDCQRVFQDGALENNDALKKSPFAQYSRPSAVKSCCGYWNTLSYQPNDDERRWSALIV